MMIDFRKISLLSSTLEVDFWIPSGGDFDKPTSSLAWSRRRRRRLSL